MFTRIQPFGSDKCSSLGNVYSRQATASVNFENSAVFAFLCDVYVVTSPRRVGDVYVALQEELFRHSRIRINVGKTQVWNAGGVRPEACDMLERIAQANDRNARVWRGSGVSTAECGTRILGTPLGHADYVQEQLNLTLGKHHVLLSRIPLIEDVQSAWSLLVHCAGTRANYLLRVIRPELVHTFAEGHNRGLWNCLHHILSIDSQVDETVRDIGSLPLFMGGLGLRSATRTSQPAFWASWADCLTMIGTRHPDVAALILLRMQGPDTPPTLAAAASAAMCLSGVEGFEPPSWEALANGERPPMREPDDFEPGDKRHGWQHEAASRIERQHRGRLMPRFAEQEQALLRSQSGPLAGVAFSTTPSSYLKRIESHLFRVLLLRRLRLSLPLSARQCRCGRPLDVFLPPSRCMCQSGGSGTAGVCSGECWCPHLPRRRSQGRDQRTSSGFRLGCSRSSRPTPVGDFGRRIAAFRWRAAGSGHDARVPVALRWFPSPSCSKRRWGCLGRGAAPERENLPRTCASSAQSTTGGSGRRGWRQMVGGDQMFPLHPRQGQSEVRTPHLAQECGASMAHAVGCSAWLCSSSCVRCLLVGVETRRRSGRRRPRHQRGGERLSPRRFDVSKGGVRT